MEEPPRSDSAVRAGASHADRPRSRGRRAVVALALAAVAAALLLYGLARTPFRGLYDDVDRALIARTMADRGDWVVPVYHGRPLTTKPPLFYWTAGLLYRLTGRRDELPGALASVLAGALVLLATWATSRRLLGPRAGPPAVLMLLTSYLFLSMFRQPLIDTAMMAGFALSFWALAGAVTEPDRRERWWLLVFAGLGVSTLAKGPIPLPLLVLMSVPLWDRRPRSLPPGRAVLGGVALVLAMMLPWAVLLLARVPEARGVLEYELFGRVGSHFQPHAWTRRPWWFYLADLGNFAPWLPLLPAGLVFAWRRRRERPYRLLLWWALGGLVFFSLASANKRSYYLLPLYPAFAMLCAAVVAGSRQGAPVPRRLLNGGLVVCAGLLGLLGVAALILPLRFGLSPAPLFLAAGAGAIVLAVAALAALRRRTRPWPALLAATVLLELVWVGHLVPPLNAYIGGKPFYEEAAARIGAPPDAPVVVFHASRSLAAFYLDRPVLWPESAPLAAAVDAGGTAWLVADPDRLDRYEGPGRPEMALESTLRSPLGQRRRLGLYRLVAPGVGHDAMPFSGPPR